MSAIVPGAGGLVSSSRFEIRRELGAGGMGRVYEAFDRERGAVVALKTLQHVSAVALARFKSEFRSLADVVHPNLVALYELVVEGDAAFFTMERVDGVHFDQWVRPAPALDAAEGEPSRSAEVAATQVAGTSAPALSGATATPATQVGTGGGTRSGSGDTASGAGSAGGAAIVAPAPAPASAPRPLGSLDVHRLRLALRQLAEGVDALHDAGLLHRDLKPSNVMVTPEGRVVILDFGLVAVLEDEKEGLRTREARALEGTAAYMSPEQAARHNLTPASDWYSVGGILYEALTRHRPFAGGRDQVLMDKQRFEPPAPRELAPDCPEDLDVLCSELLRRRPERRPAGDDVVRRLGGDPSTAPPSSSSGTSSTAEAFVGRVAELAALDRALRDSLDAGPVVVHVHGPSGMGKSRVVRTFLDGLESPWPMLVLRGRCYERESMPFKAVDSLVDALARHLATLPRPDVEPFLPRDTQALVRVFPVLRQIKAITDGPRDVTAATAPDPQELRRRAFGALRELLARLAGHQPVVLAIDDLQWGDADSASLLAAVLRPPAPPAILLVASWRRDERAASEFLRRFDHELAGVALDVREVMVDALSDDQAIELARLRLGERPDLAAQAARIAHEAHGSPFFVEELARHVRELRGPVEISLDQALRTRLLRLPDAAGRLLATVAVAGRPIPQILAARAAGVTDPAMLSLLRAGSLLQPRTVDGARYVDAYHDRIREAALALLGDGELRDTHARLAQVFEAGPRPDPEVLAMHHAGAGDAVRAATHAMAAGRHAAETLAFDRAATFFRMALEQSADTAGRGAWVELGNALANAGRSVDAAAAYEAAVAGAGRAEALDLRCRAATQLLYSGRSEEGLARIDRVLAQAGLHLTGPGRALPVLLWNRARLKLRGTGFVEREEREIPVSQLVKVDVSFAAAAGLGLVDTMRGADFHSRAVLLALRAGELRRVHRAIVGEAAFVSTVGVRSRARTAPLLALARDLTARLGSPEARAMYQGVLGICAFNWAEWQEAYDRARESEIIFRDQCVGVRWELGTCQVYQCFSMSQRGRITELLARTPALLAESYDRGDLFVATNVRAAIGLYAHLQAGRPQRAYDEIDDAMAAWPQAGVHVPHCNALHSRVNVDLYRDDAMAAHLRIEGAWPAVERSRLLTVYVLRAGQWSARGRAALSAYRHARQPAIRRIVERSVQVLARERTASATGASRMLAGGLAILDGDRERAVTALAEAEAASAAASAQLVAAAVRWARGRMVGGDEGAALCASAEAVFAGEGLRDVPAAVRMFGGIGGL